MKSLPILLLGFVLACTSVQKSLTREEAVAEITPEEFFTYLGDLSSDEMRGRNTGSPEYDSAARYVASKVQQMGLLPAGDDGTFFQSVPFRSATHGQPPKLAINGAELAFEKDFGLRPSRSVSEVALSAPVVFVGLGISAPDLGYDDYADVDVAGKFVMFIEDLPTAFSSLEKTVLGRSREETAMKRGAVGVIMVTPQKWLEPITRWTLMTRRLSRRSFGTVEPAGSPFTISAAINYLKATELMMSVGRDYASIYEGLLEGKPQSFEFGFDAALEGSFDHADLQSPNVAALMPGGDSKLKDEVVVLSAHLDHVGVGNPVKGDSIYNGTLDNASGSAAALTIANTLSKMDAPKRSVLFLWVTGEEKGLLGSEYWAKYPTIERDRIVANQNMDMLNGLFMGAEDIVAYGYEHSNLSEAVDFAQQELAFQLMNDPTPQQNFFVRSDQYRFVQQGIPAIWIWTRQLAAQDQPDSVRRWNKWWKQHYHRPSDDMTNEFSEEGLLQELRANFLMTHYISNEMSEILWDQNSFLYHQYRRRLPGDLLISGEGIDEE